MTGRPSLDAKDIQDITAAIEMFEGDGVKVTAFRVPIPHDYFFTAVFLVQALTAMGCRTVRISEGD